MDTTVRFTNGAQPPAAGAVSPRSAATAHGSGEAPAGRLTATPGQAPVVTSRTMPDPAGELDALLERVAEYIDPEQHALSIEVREELGRTVVSVYDTRTEELVRQIPPEELLRIATVMRDLSEQREQRVATGLLLDELA